MTSLYSDAPRLNLVLVDDHDILREMLTQALEDAGHQVVALSCAEELEDVAAVQPVDVFLFDLNLPGEDGLSLTERVRAAYPLAGLIVVTARSSLHDKLEGYARGSDMYLTKPIKASELCAVVAAIGRRHKTMDELLASKSWKLSQREMRLTQPGQPEVSLTADFVRLSCHRMHHPWIQESVQHYRKQSHLSKLTQTNDVDEGSETSDDPRWPDAKVSAPIEY